MPSLRRLVWACAPTSLFVLSAVAQDPRWFAAPMLEPLATRTYVAVADLDLDGDADVLAVDTPGYFATSFTPLLNDGTGLLLPGVTVPLPGTGGGSWRVLDVGGDGIPDLVVVTIGHPLGNGLLLYVGQGGGGFAAPSFVPTGDAVAKVAVGDVDGDPFGDLLLQTSNGTTILSRWLQGTAANTFAPGPLAALPFQPAGSVFPALAFPLVVADFDGDQLDDVAVVVSGTGSQHFEVFLGAALSAGALIPVTAHAGSDLVIARIDFDQDGDLDLAVSGTPASTGSLSLIENQGGGAWLETSVMSLPNYVAGPLHAADWDGDGRDDLVMQSSSTISSYHAMRWFRSTGPGAFELVAQALELPEYGYGAAGCVDLDGDGNVDVVDDRTVVFGDGTFVVAPPEAGNRITDWDGDGDLDLIDGNSARLWRSDGRAPGASTTLVMPPVPGWVASTWEFLGDLDGDALPELSVRYLLSPPVPGGVETRLVRVGGDGALFDDGPRGLGYSGLGAGAAPFVYDFDGDGDLDVCCFEQPYLNDGSQDFTPSGVSYGANCVVVAPGDVDNDGAIDFLCYDTVANGLVVSRRSGPASFATQALYTGVIVTPALEPRGVLQDLDDDGDLDCVGVRGLNATLREVVVFENVGGVFTLAATLPFDGPVTAGDVDGDGLTDLCVRSPSPTGGFLTVLRRVGPGFTYAPPVRFTTPAPRALADFDQDGDLDAIGPLLVRSRRFVEPDSGYRRQYGQGSPGTGGKRMQLSVSGTIRPGNVPSVEMSRLPGGTFVFLFAGLSEADAPSVVLPGVNDYVGNVQLFLAFATGGGPNGGFVSLPLALGPGAAGARLFLELVAFDPAAPFGLTYSNGCELFVGL
ncbi:MAG: VCBS repeat-containing protein [Planctomycetes bacterium]|nr:VCBS repeat-containing protein [Planctomycetota bacterium]